uniref:Coatomer subunit zeta n=1 Tax=Apteryx owenii TaxID=8824 RepID=A0A8B9SAJ5_APTOW
MSMLIPCLCPHEPSLYAVKAVVILDNDGDRLFAKYYDDTYPSAKEQKAFEKNIFNKTHRTDSRCRRVPRRVPPPGARSPCSKVSPWSTRAASTSTST